MSEGGRMARHRAASRPAPPETGGAQLRIDPIRCAGHGLCAELLPELLDRDEWGYPDPMRADVPAALTGLARRAVRACPTLAVRLEPPGR